MSGCGCPPVELPGPSRPCPRSAGSIDRVSIRVVGIGGSVDAGSQSDRVLRAVLTAVAGLGAEVEVFSGLDLDLPPYHSGAVLPAARRDYVDRGPPRRRAGDQLARVSRHRVRPGEERPGLPGGAARRPPSLPGRPRGRRWSPWPAVGRPRLAPWAPSGRWCTRCAAGRPRWAWRSTAPSPRFDERHGRTDAIHCGRAVAVMAGQLVDFAGRRCGRTPRSPTKSATGVRSAS